MGKAFILFQDCFQTRVNFSILFRCLLGEDFFLGLSETHWTRVDEYALQKMNSHFHQFPTPFFMTNLQWVFHENPMILSSFRLKSTRIKTRVFFLNLDSKELLLTPFQPFTNWEKFETVKFAPTSPLFITWVLWHLNPSLWRLCICSLANGA